MGAKRSAFETVEAESGAGQLPSGFLFTCKAYDETSELTLDLRLSLLTGGGEPSFRLRVMRHDAVIREIAEDVEERIKQAIGDDTLRVFVGHIETAYY